jgi:transcriptional antiterminator RfaH
VQKVRRGKAVTVTEAMFARYLFVRLDSSSQGKSWSPIRSTLGVRGMVQFGGRPAKVADRLIESLRALEQVAEPKRLFEPGDRVVVDQGPFAGLEAIVQAHDGEHRALILLELLSKPVSLAIDAGHLRRN